MTAPVCPAAPGWYDHPAVLLVPPVDGGHPGHGVHLPSRVVVPPVTLLISVTDNNVEMEWLYVISTQEKIAGS